VNVIFGSNVLTFTVHDLVCGKENAKGIHINMSETMYALSLWQSVSKERGNPQLRVKSIQVLENRQVCSQLGNSTLCACVTWSPRILCVCFAETYASTVTRDSQVPECRELHNSSTGCTLQHILLQ